MNLLTLLLAIFASLVSSAQISTDGSLGSAMELTGPDYTVGQDLGRRAGSNLFHSFQEFNINTGESVTFTGDPSLQRIISRVTGRKLSNINGLLKSEIPNSDFYFMNPAGVMFGASASIDINGAFHVTTADFLKFGNNETFFSQPLKNEVLSTEAPTTYGFLDAEIGKITFEGSDISLKEGESFTTISGDINAEDSTITVPQGEVDLISVASDGEVQLTSDDSGSTSFNLESFTEFGDIFFESDSTLNVNGEGGGKVTFHGRDVQIDRSQILAITSGAENGRGVEFNVSDHLEITNSAQVVTATTGSGRAGNITIFSGNLNIVNGSLLNIVTVEAGHGGNVRITANSMNVDGQGSIDSTGILSITASGDDGGDGGSIRIETTSLGIISGGIIASGTLGNGEAGSIAINAETMVIDGEGQNTAISSSTSSKNGGGKAGDIAIDTDTLKIMKGGNIDTSTLGSGDGGSIRVTAETIDIDGLDDASLFTGLDAGTSLKEGMGGKGGNIDIDTSTLNIFNGGVIQTPTSGSGDGGSISISAEMIRIDDHGHSSLTGISTLTGLENGSGSGKGGNISINTNKLDMVNGGVIQAPTRGRGDGGSMRIVAERISIDGYSGMNAVTVSKFDGGKGGDISIQTNILDILNRGFISVQTTGSGDAGNVSVMAETIFIDGQGASVATGMDADTLLENNGGKGGDITIQTKRLDIVDGATISADTEGSGDGGNIHITANDLFIDVKEASSLTGFSAETRSVNGGGNGGSITINTQILDIVNGGEITVVTEGSGDASSIHITAKTILLDSKGSLPAVAVINAQTELEAGAEKRVILPFIPIPWIWLTGVSFLHQPLAVVIAAI